MAANFLPLFSVTYLQEAKGYAQHVWTPTVDICEQDLTAPPPAPAPPGAWHVGRAATTGNRPRKRDLTFASRHTKAILPAGVPPSGGSLEPPLSALLLLAPGLVQPPPQATLLCHHNRK